MALHPKSDELLLKICRAYNTTHSKHSFQKQERHGNLSVLLPTLTLQSERRGSGTIATEAALHCIDCGG